jgi:hypothetical protein
VWISRTTQDRLTRANTQLAERQAAQQAANPVLMGLARAAAKDAIRQNLAIPLQVAGFGAVTVAVWLDGEPGPPQQTPSFAWDIAAQSLSGRQRSEG